MSVGSCFKGRVAFRGIREFIIRTHNLSFLLAGIFLKKDWVDSLRLDGQAAIMEIKLLRRM